jgi:hypothetical protein
VVGKDGKKRHARTRPEPVGKSDAEGHEVPDHCLEAFVNFDRERSGREVATD